MNEKKSFEKLLKILYKESEKLEKPVNLMEVCGTHTMAISRFGIRSRLPEKIKLISGPGCPVCVTPITEVDKTIEISKQKNVIITTFGDMLKVPGTKSSLMNEKAKGRDIRVVYSPSDALLIAKENPDKKVVFIGIGFETTAPLIAYTMKEAKKQKIKNFYVLSFFKVIIPPMEALLNDKDLKLNGFICPGHVSAITGAKIYEPLVEKYKIPCVVIGFEAIDILTGILMLLKQMLLKKPAVEIQYKRVVKYEGNKYAQDVLKEVFTESDSVWRGIGLIPGSGLKLNENYSEFDAEKIFDIDVSFSKEPVGCKCGDVLKGIKIPTECPFFGKKCTPEKPVGACMVSSEGTCAAYYKYEVNK